MLRTLYVGEGAGGGAETAAGHFEALLRLAAAYQFREEGIPGHLRRISAYVELLAKECGWPPAGAMLLSQASLFHDVGMIDAPEDALRQQGALDAKKTTMIRLHAELGRNLLGDGGPPLMAEASTLAWTHHECFDGSGYPRGIRGGEIPQGARILAVADVFDALTTRRPFKDPYPVDVALDIILADSGKRFDPAVVSALVAVRADFVEVCARLALPVQPSRPGFRISARDVTDGRVLSATSDAYFCCPFCHEMHPHEAATCPAQGQTLRSIHKLSGRILGDRYQVRVPRGVGGMSTVYEALHLLIGRRLAIKFLDADKAPGWQNLERFRNEARFCSTVGHPNLVDITDMGETVEGIPYIVMELLDGMSLADLMFECGRLSAAAAITIAIEVLNTLAAVHAKGIVHRDLKPENIYLVKGPSGPRLKVLDFGVSLLLSPDGRNKRVTGTGDSPGTPAYMSPEQARGVPDVDHRSDLFSVGTILYEMLAGHCLFDGPNPFATLAAVTSCQVEPLRNHTPDVDPDLERVVLRSLEREPRDRYQSAKEFLQPLLAVARRDSRYLEGRILDLDPRLRQLA